MPVRPLTPPGLARTSYTPTLRSLIEGQVLCYEGDPPGPLYVICSGSVRAYRRSRSVPDTIEELAHLGPGEIVGELAPMLKQVRSATVQALEPTEVLEVPVVQVSGLLKQHKALLRVLTAALKDRAGLTHSEVAALVNEQGADVSLKGIGGSTADSAPLSFAAPEHDASIVYPKRLVCPVCSAQFFSLVVHPQQDRPAERDSDFHQLYRTEFNPYDYELWVCPNDLYTAFPADFGEISDLQRPRVAEVVAAVVADWDGDRPDFNAERNLRMREKSLELALALYRMRNATPLRMAAVLHRLAWCARERGDAQAERSWLSQALQAYSMAYNQFDLEGPKTVLRVAYLCGELNARLGDTRAAIRWCSEGLRHPEIKDHPHWEGMLRQQWATLRTEPAAET
jgi:uncharacterized protein (DUF2225 family)